MPFCIPDSWAWCRLGDISDMALGKMLDKDKNQGDYKPYLRNINVRWGSFDLSDVLQMKFESSETDRYSVHKGDLLVCEGGEPGRCAVWDSNNDMMIQKALHRVRMFGGISSYYIAYVIESFTFAKILEGYYTGSTIKHLTGISLSQMLVPVPPLSEQCRIVNSVNIWQEIINKFNYNKEYLSKLLEQAKLKILDLAIHGKLVHQNEKDEPASKILKRIYPNYKPADTSHYENLPHGWCVCALEDIIDYEQPQPYIVESTAYSDDCDTPVLTAGKSFIIGYTNETRGIVNDLPVIIFDDFTTDSKYVDFPFKVKSSAMKILRVKSGVNPRFITMLMSITRLTSDTHKRYWISEYSKITMMLPPIEEQRRIVDKAKELCKQLDLISQILTD
jgi:type I restriction enzyme S subunit